MIAVQRGCEHCCGLLLGETCSQLFDSRRTIAGSSQRVQVWVLSEYALRAKATRLEHQHSRQLQRPMCEAWIRRVRHIPGQPVYVLPCSIVPNALPHA